MKIRMALLSMIGVFFSSLFFVKKVYERKMSAQQEKVEKYAELYQMMDQWVKIKQRGESLSTYFTKNGYHEIAVYGIGNMGNALINELKDSEIIIKYGIDRKGGELSKDFMVLLPENELDKVDAVVVSTVAFYDEIESFLHQKMKCPILSLEDILYEI